MSLDKLDFEPVSDMVLVKVEKLGDTTESGIYVGEMNRGSVTAKVLAVGPGRYSSDGSRIPLQISPGDKVLLDPISGVELEIEGEKVKCLREAEIISIVRYK